MSAANQNRRRFMKNCASLGLIALGGCDRLTEQRQIQGILGSAESLTERVQRSLLSSDALAREFTEADISPIFRANGTTNPQSLDYQRLAASGFADWQLQVEGMVERRGAFSLADLKAMPSRTQITRHDCVEGWSCIGQWKGVRLSAILDAVRPQPEARYVVFYCADKLGGLAAESYYESIDFLDAYHEQTILAYEMNGQALPVPYGAPLRLRVERQLGYKMAKYVMRIELVESFAQIAGGKGGFWEDRGYEWYAGI